MPTSTDPSEALDNSIHELLPQLHSENQVVRTAAASKLRALPRGSTTSLLVQLLEGEDPTVRGDAATALILIDAIAGIPLILPLLADPTTMVRFRVCGMLHDRGDVRVTEPLAQVVLKDPISDIRVMACAALARHGDIRAMDALRWAIEHDDAEDVQGLSVQDAAEGAIEAIMLRSVPPQP